jgi:uncharacterized membrane protein
MERRTRGWSDEHVQLIVGYFLRTGIIIASVIVFIGGILYLIKYGADFPEYRIFSGEPARLRNVHGIIADAFSLRSRDIIQFGLLLLMFTPVAWVAFLLFAFARQRDRTYIVIAAIVLGTLLFSIAGRYFFR